MFFLSHSHTLNKPSVISININVMIVLRNPIHNGELLLLTVLSNFGHIMCATSSAGMAEIECTGNWNRDIHRNH